jgi:predicted Rossmann-fold nucleotide-binding protein
MMDWIKKTLLEMKKISEEDIDLFSCVDTTDEVISILEKFYAAQETGPNF